LPLALTGKLALDTLAAGKLSVDQWTKHHAFCGWCLLSAGLIFASFPLSWKEVRVALQTITHHPT